MVEKSDMLFIEINCFHALCKKIYARADAKQEIDFPWPDTRFFFSSNFILEFSLKFIKAYPVSNAFGTKSFIPVR